VPVRPVGVGAITELLSLPDCAYRTMPMIVRIAPPRITKPAISPRRAVLPAFAKNIGGACVAAE
jgi:hypothetical protein